MNNKVFVVTEMDREASNNIYDQVKVSVFKSKDAAQNFMCLKICENLDLQFRSSLSLIDEINKNFENLSVKSLDDITFNFLSNIDLSEKEYFCANRDVSWDIFGHGGGVKSYYTNIEWIIDEKEIEN